jgi:hypothetical protein
MGTGVVFVNVDRGVAFQQAQVNVDVDADGNRHQRQPQRLFPFELTPFRG